MFASFWILPRSIWELRSSGFLGSELSTTATSTTAAATTTTTNTTAAAIRCVITQKSAVLRTYCVSFKFQRVITSDLCQSPVCQWRVAYANQFVCVCVCVCVCNMLSDGRVPAVISNVYSRRIIINYIFRKYVTDGILLSSYSSLLQHAVWT